MAHGLVLHTQGRLGEAEQVWHEYLDEMQNSTPLILAVGLLNLADARHSQGKLEEALPLLEGAVALLPENGLVYRELAEFYLDHNLDPHRALAFTDAMLHFRRKPRWDFLNARVEWALGLAVRALALMGVGRFSDAHSTLEQAFRDEQKDFRPAAASLRVTAGLVYLHEKNFQRAHDYFSQAVQLDPRGGAGQRAAKHLAELAD